MAEKKKEKLNKEKVHLLRGEPYQKKMSHTTNRQGREVTTCGNNIYKDLQKKGRLKVIKGHETKVLWIVF